MYNESFLHTRTVYQRCLRSLDRLFNLHACSPQSLQHNSQLNLLQTISTSVCPAVRMKTFLSTACDGLGKHHRLLQALFG